MSKSLTADEIAARVDGIVVGNGALGITGVAALDEAGDEHLSFLGNPRYRDRVLPSAARIVLVPRDFAAAPPAGRAWVLCDDPSAVFTQFVLEFLPPPPVLPPGVHPDASVAATADIHPTAHVGANVVVQPAATIGAHAVVQGGCYIGHGADVGEHTRLYPNVTIYERCVIGRRVLIHAGTVIGSDGFGFRRQPGGHEKIPQVGIVQVDDDVEIGANCTIDRARFGRTWIRRGAKIDNLVHIAHNVVIGEDSLLLAQVGIAGSTRIGRGVILAGQVGIAGHVAMEDGSIAMGKAGIVDDVESGVKVIGVPAQPRQAFFRQHLCLRRLPELVKTVERLERELHTHCRAADKAADDST